MNPTPAFDDRRPRRVLPSIGAVLAGFALTFVLSVLGDGVMHASGIFPPFGQPMATSLFVLATLYRTVFTVAGGYLTARLAPGRPMRHARGAGRDRHRRRDRGHARDLGQGTGVRPQVVPALSDRARPAERPVRRVDPGAGRELDGRARLMDVTSRPAR